MLTDEQKEQLSQPLDPSLVKQREGAWNPKTRKKDLLSYIEGHTVKRHANEIFGFDGWSYHLESLTMVYAADRLDRDSGEVKGRKVGYTAEVSVKVGDVVREDVGFGSGFGPDDGDATEGAIKEAVTDALKRALASFGDQFGLGLYGGGQLQQQQQQQQQRQSPKLSESQIADYSTALQDAVKAKGDGPVKGVLRKHGLNQQGNWTQDGLNAALDEIGKLPDA